MSPKSHSAGETQESRITVTESTNVPYGPPLRVCHLDQPRLGAIESELIVAGWALTPDGPVESIEVVAASTVITHTPAGRSRPDVASVHSGIPRAEEGGFRTTIPLESLDDIDELTVVAVSKSGVRTPMWTIKLGPGEAGPVTPKVEAPDVPSERGRRGWFRGRR